jgi:hypothetical protein
MPTANVNTEAKPEEIVKNDLEKFSFTEINVADCLITTIAAKKRRTFVDPFVYKEHVEEGSIDTLNT